MGRIIVFVASKTRRDTTFRANTRFAIAAIMPRGVHFQYFVFHAHGEGRTPLFLEGGDSCLRSYAGNKPVINIDLRDTGRRRARSFLVQTRLHLSLSLPLIPWISLISFNNRTPRGKYRLEQRISHIFPVAPTNVTKP